MSMQDAFRNARGRKESEGLGLAVTIDESLLKTESGLMIPSRRIREVGVMETFGQRFYDVGNRWFEHRFFSHKWAIRFIRGEWESLKMQTVQENEARSDLLRKLALGMHLGEDGLFPLDVVWGKTVSVGFTDTYLSPFIDGRFSAATNVFLAGLSDLSDYTPDQMNGFKAFILEAIPPTDYIHLPQTFSLAGQWFLQAA